MRPSAEPEPQDVPNWLQKGAAISWRLVAVAGAVFLVLYLLALLRVIVLPVIIALLVTTLLLPPVRWLRRRGLSDGLSTALAMVGSVIALGLILDRFLHDSPPPGLHA